MSFCNLHQHAFTTVCTYCVLEKQKQDDSKIEIDSELTPGTKLTLPVIHSNGTGRDALAQQYSDAYEALNVARTKLRECRPHGRDYYVSRDPDAQKKATAQHEARDKALGAVMTELELMSESIAFGD